MSRAEKCTLSNLLTCFDKSQYNNIRRPSTQCKDRKDKTETTHFPREKACEGKEKNNQSTERTKKKNRNPNNPSLEVSYPEEKKIHAQVYVWTPDKHKDRQDTRAPVIYPLIIVGKKEETRKKNRINPVRNQPRRSTRVENADQKNIVGK